MRQLGERAGVTYLSTCPSLRPGTVARWRRTRPDEGNGHLFSSTFGERRTLALDHDCLRTLDYISLRS
jgi:hypothetical protein